MMSGSRDIREGMQVYGGDQLLGRVASVEGDTFHVNGLPYTREMVTHVENDTLYLGDSGGRGATVVTGETLGTDTGADLRPAPGATGTRDTARAGDLTDREIHVPLAEERLLVGKREVERGEVNIRTTVTEEEQTVPITLSHEEVHIERHTVADRPATGIEGLFEEKTIQVTLRGEEAVIAKEAIVTGEVVIEKDAVSEEQQFTDTVRSQHVDVDRTFPSTATTGVSGGATSATDGSLGSAAQLRESMPVLGADEERIGVIKEVRANDFLVDRRLARDVYVPFSAIQRVTGAGVTIKVDAGDVNDQGWPNP